MSKREIARKYDAIVDFASLRDFIDTPVKRYSSGMYVRLAFAVAAHLEPDILLIDEVLSVGDLPFQRKCMDYARSMQRSNAIILFVSHNMFSIKTLCQRVIYLKQGRIIYDGPTEGGIKLYEEDCRSLMPLRTEDRPEEWPVCITSVSVSDENGAAKTVFDYGERLKIRLTLEAARPILDPGIIVAFIRSDGVACCNFSSELDGFESGRVSGTRTIELLTPPLKLVAELYTIHVLVREEGFQKVLCAQLGGAFHVSHDILDTNFGVFHELASWSFRSSIHMRNTLHEELLPEDPSV
jgi:lipopolysaccharide transport system ATP-binding protein